MLAAPAAEAAAQARTAGTFQPSRQIFGRLFPADPRGRLRPAAPSRTTARERPANRECAGCADRPGGAHFVMESPRLTNTWLARHRYDANGGPYGDNAAIADFWYDAVHRRLFTRSLVLHEVEDPADLRLGRAPGSYPNAPDFAAVLEPGTTVGHVGFVRWGANGFGSYFAAVQGAVRDAGTGYLDLATATGESGSTRTGSPYSPEDLIKHVRLHPSGQLEVGFETDPAARPETSLVVRGNAQIEGTLVVGGSPVGPPVAAPVLACRVLAASGRGRGASAACDAGWLATGGGGRCVSGEMRSSQPVLAGDLPAGWAITCSREGTHAASVICCAR
ncbi:MAG: hypothetical protein ACRD26_03205 [Vicinamibacterales bacterium]